VVILHGLEGTLHSHYAQGLLTEAYRRQWSATLVLWRSCSGEINRARRFYHSGETSDLAIALAHIARKRPYAPIAAVGVSLGGNILLKFLGECGTRTPDPLVAAAAVSVPFDLARGSDFINHGFSRVYQRYFLDSLKDKVRKKLQHYPDLITTDRLDMLATLSDFDNALTAPIHGFVDALDYYTQSSSIHYLDTISIGTLLLNAQDDPFLPPEVLETVHHIARRNPQLHAEFPRRGGHAGFVAGWNPFRPIYYLERRVGEFFATQFAV
jgi:predicted alpha/beta-fold hydrolase